MKEIYKNIFMGDIRLPKNPLRSLNSYIIRSGDSALIIDAGFDAPQSEEDFFEELEVLELHKGSVDLYLTHLHADHTGLAAKFQKTYGGRVYMSRIDAEYVQAMIGDKYFETQQFPPEFFGLKNDGHFFDAHPAVLYCAKEPIEFTYVREGDRIVVGEYEFEVLFIPGHTPGQTALYERTHCLLFSGDHILDNITPNIAFWGFEHGDILQTYLDMLTKIERLDVRLLLPAHRVLIEDPKKRIEELRAHHRERLDDILRILADKKPHTVAEVAARMHWDFRTRAFSEFPPNQQWFACGEAMAHLEHLRFLGRVEISEKDAAPRYRLK